jgi:hypothetical protein
MPAEVGGVSGVAALVGLAGWLVASFCKRANVEVNQ